MAAKRKLPEWFLKCVSSVKAKRPKTVLKHILKHGHVTTEELAALYGYNHPPRAARDVRELGIPLETFRVKSKEGRSIGAYRFADLTKVRHGRLRGRRVLPKELKRELIRELGCKCCICLEDYEARYLQVDHRVPYEVSGDSEGTKAGHFTLVCGTCNRAKSWSCEHCPNWLKDQSPRVCRSCYWAHPASYTHVCGEPIRRIDLVWTKQEVPIFEELRRRAVARGENIPAYVKAALAKHVRNSNLHS